MDKILMAFTEKYINKFSSKDLIKLEKLLDLDDATLYNYYNGLKINIDIKNNNINLLFKNFKYEKK